MNGQITIFDLANSIIPTPDINDITEEEAVRIVGERIGVTFVYNTRLQRWQCKRGKLTMGIGYSHFNLTDNHALFLDVGYICGTSGGGSPTSGIDEAVKYFKAKMEWAKEVKRE